MLGSLRVVDERFVRVRFVPSLNTLNKRPRVLLAGAPGPARRTVPSTAKTEPEGASQVKTILLVDDNPSERSVIGMAVDTLTSFRICDEASNGTEAIRKAKELKPDLIIMDLSMPMMNGLEAAAILKNELPGVPIIVFTMYDDLIHGPRSAMFGVSAVLSKAEGLAPLLECMKKLLGHS